MDGTVVSVGADKLTMADKEGKEHSHALAANVKVTCDGKTCTALDLKAGMRIRVTTDTTDQHAATRIEALDKDTAFASSSHDGKAVSITGVRIVMTNMEGAEEHTYTLNADVKVTCDGKVCKTMDLKPGMRVRVTTENGEPHTATRIEALDSNRDFDKAA
jgi:GH24 family phage-related lysozyme (muramidase)